MLLRSHSTHVSTESIRFSSFPLLIQFSCLRESKVNCEMESFRSICESLKVSPETSSEWMAKLQQQYSGPKRHFHNSQMLEKKFRLIEDVARDEPFRNSLSLAILFQYYHYDVKRDLKQENCDEFKLFVDQSGLKDVSSRVSNVAKLSSYKGKLFLGESYN